MISISFHYAYKKFYFSNRQRIKEHIACLFKKEKTNLASLDIVFTNRKEIMRINKQFLHHSYYTDIITFNLAHHSKDVVGEIYICVPEVKLNALHYETSFTKELQRVIFHGCLHLCGYRDKTPTEIEQMRKKENYYLLSVDSK